MEISDIVIDGFSPNCLIGATGAIAKFKYKIDNVNKLFFNHSYIYEKKEEITYLPETNQLDVSFTRELPIDKDEFSKRVFDYYGLCHYTLGYSDFNKMTEDIQRLIKTNEPVIVAIDFYYMKKYRAYHKAHDHHLMIIYDVDLENKYFCVCEAVFGYMKIGFDEYYEYFNEIKFSHNRDVYTMIMEKEKNSNHVSCLDNFIADIDKSLSNLTTENSHSSGMGAFQQFVEDFLCILDSGIIEDRVSIQGMWVFMCNCLNNAKFIAEFKNEFTDFSSKELDQVRKQFNISNRKWFTITTDLNELSKQNTDKFKIAFHKLMELDRSIISNLKIVREQLVEYRQKKKLNKEV